MAEQAPVPAQEQVDSAELQAFTEVRAFTDNKGPISCIDFHRVDDLLVTAGDDDSIHLYNTARGTLEKTLWSKKYGVGCICFTHHPNAILCGSKNDAWDETLRYLSLHDNRYLRYFKGHRDQVVAVCMSPKTDAFLSASLDKTMRLWDLRTNACQGLLQVQCAIQPSIAFDQQGLVFAVSTEDGLIKMYDARMYEKGPFTTFTTPPAHPGGGPNTFTSLQFSYDGSRMLATTPRQLFVLDAYEGHVLREIRLPDGPPATERLLFSGSYSPDDTYVLSGAPDSGVHVWNCRQEGMPEVARWSGFAGVPTCVKWAPRRKLVAVADTHGTLSLRTPRQHDQR